MLIKKANFILKINEKNNFDYAIFKEIGFKSNYFTQLEVIDNSAPGTT